ncbi:hypothetical protein AM592_16035 [Bacillus gobiensis]|uniref:Uncharacterized protein n=1 Tax=Bacillus gobiensis TaxID=1441095 RepID=A0A0M5JAJ4_9BACI|nr:hypothetical protein AM592_16035 [Bacillus gobiensis]
MFQPHKRVDVFLRNQSSEYWYIYDFLNIRAGFGFAATSTTQKNQLLFIKYGETPLLSYSYSVLL